MKQEVKDMQEIYMEITLKLQDLSNEELVAEYQKTHNEEYLKMLMDKETRALSILLPVVTLLRAIIWMISLRRAL